MKKATLLPIVLIALSIVASGQESSHRDSVVSFVYAYVPGEQDSVRSSTSMKFLNKDQIINGLQLSLSDTTYSVIGYSISFDIYPSIIVGRNNTGALWNLTAEEKFWTDQLEDGALFVIDNIRVAKEGRSGKLPSLVYYITEPDERSKKNTHKHPLICHDKEKFLSCVSAGKSILSFKDGDFKGYRSWDSLLTYDYVQREMRFVYYDKDAFRKDTITIKLESDRIIFYRGLKSLELNSMENIPSNISHFGIAEYTLDKYEAVLNFNTKGRTFKLKISKIENKWSWDVEINYMGERFVMQLNPYFHNRAEIILLENTQTGHMVYVDLTFRTRKKVWQVQTRRYQSNEENGQEKITWDVGEGIWFEYNRRGRLKRGYQQPVICTCE